MLIFHVLPFTIDFDLVAFLISDGNVDHIWSSKVIVTRDYRKVKLAFKKLLLVVILSTLVFLLKLGNEDSNSGAIPISETSKMPLNHKTLVFIISTHLI